MFFTAICEKREAKGGNKSATKRVNLKLKSEDDYGYKCCD